MGLSYQPKAITLSFKEGKPVTYKAQQVTYPTIKSKDLLAYAANAANAHQFEDYPEPRRGGCGTLSPMPFAYVAPSTR